MSRAGIPTILLDTDPGGDDALAMLWLLSLVKQGVANLIAVTAAAGNVAAPQTFSNASQILSLTGFAQVELGRPVLKQDVSAQNENAGHIHGEDGIGRLSQTLPPAAHRFETARAADEIIINTLTAAPGKITILAIGPLTNLAAAEAKQPGILRQAKAIVIMAGAFHCPGNITPHAEFNVWFNAKAAQAVCSSRDDLVILPLDVTRHLICTPEMVQAATQSNPGSQLAQFLQALCKFMTGTALQYRETAGTAGFLVHDAAVLSYLFYPETLLLRRAAVQVETAGEWTIGQTLVDDRPLAKTNANAWIAAQIDVASFFASLLADLKYLIERS